MANPEDYLKLQRIINANNSKYGGKPRPDICLSQFYEQLRLIVEIDPFNFGFIGLLGFARLNRLIAFDDQKLHRSNNDRLRDLGIDNTQYDSYEIHGGHAFRQYAPATPATHT